MGLVIINEKYRVNVDANCLTLQHFKGINTNKETGEKTELWSNDGYFTSWENVLSRLIKVCTADEINKREKIYLKELKSVVQGCTNEIKTLLKDSGVNF